MKQTVTILIITFFLVSSQSIMGQANWSFEQKVDFNRYTSYEGTINNGHQIMMYLKESYETCNKNSNHRTLRKVYGWYQYNNAEKKVPLVGFACYDDACNHFLELFVPQDPIKYSFDKNCRLLKAKETFRQESSWQAGTFEWQTNDGQKHSINLKPVHTFSWATNATILFNINGVEIETFNLNALAKNDYIESIEIVGEKRVDNKFHLLLKYSHQSKPGSYGNGMCGNGIEEFIAHLVVDNDFEVEAFESQQLRSCIYNIYNAEVFFDVNQPELGIRKKAK